MNGLQYPFGLEVLNIDVPVKLEEMALPGSLIQLTFVVHSASDPSVEYRSRSSNLHTLCLDSRQPINCLLPPNVTKLMFAERFNQSIQCFKFPHKLQHLQFGEDFNQPIGQILFPATLETLEFGCNFNQPLHEILLPPSLKQLHFCHGNSYDFKRFDSIVNLIPRLPFNLEQLTLPDAFNHDLSIMQFPPALKRLDLGNRFNFPLDQVQFLPSLEYLALGSGFHPSLEFLVHS